MSYLPSKKLAPTVIASLIVLVGIVTATLYSRNRPALNPTNNLVLSETANTIENKIAEIDSDQDGLKDWEEQLLSTDPQSKDTDGDSTNDNEEVKLGRDPLKKGPNDKLNPTQTPGTITTGTLAVKKDSETDRIAQQFFVEYMSIKKSGGTLSETQQEQIIENLLARSEYATVLPTYYSMSDFKVIKSSPDSLRAYGNAVALAMTRNNPGNLENELAILEDAVNAQDDVIVLKLEKNISMYKAIIEDLLKVQVPADAVSAHTDLVNGFSATITHIQSFKKVFEDPALTLSSVQKYMDSAITVSNSINSIGNIIRKSGIKYTVDEPAYSLFELGV